MPHLTDIASKLIPDPIKVLAERVYCTTRSKFRTLVHGDIAPKLFPLDSLVENLEKIQLKAEEKVHLPEIGTMKFIRAAAHLHDASYRIPEDYVTELSDVLYYTPGNFLLTNDYKIISESVGRSESFFRSGPRILRARLDSAKTIPGVCTLLRSRSNNYYHTLIDNSPRLAAIANSPYAKSHTISILHDGPLRPYEDHFSRRLAPQNSQFHELERNTAYRLEKLLFTPFKSRDYSAYLSKTYLDIIHDEFTPRRPPTKSERIYISRDAKERNGRAITNEAEVIAGLEPFRFQKHKLEDYSFDEQVKLFYDAEIIIGAHGAGLANLLFARDAKVIELFASQRVVPHYYFLSRSAGLNYYYQCSNEQSRDASFQVDVAQLVNLVRRIQARPLLKGQST